MVGDYKNAPQGAFFLHNLKSKKNSPVFLYTYDVMKKCLIASGLVFFIVLFFPISVFAQVRINEVAWMGDSVSSSHEWIELFSNNDVSLEGWSLSALDGSPSIALSGSISGGYFLLERTSDESVVGVAADQIYTGALSNSGEILVLKDANGTEVDRVDGSDGWSIGGDNSTKETLQWNGGSWSTAIATPRKQNGGGAVEKTTQTQGTESAPSTQGGFTGIAPLHITLPKSITTVVGADTLFSAQADNGVGTVFDAARFKWSFGDGVSLQGNNIYHVYQYPGTYIIFVTARYGRQTATAKVSIMVSAFPLSITASDAEKIVIQNDSDNDIDISRYRITSGEHTFIFPDNTFIAGNTSIIFSAKVIGFPLTDAILQYPSGLVAAQQVPAVKEVMTPKVVAHKSVPAITEVEKEAPPIATSTLPAAVTAAETRKVSQWVYIWGMFLVLVAGAMMWVRRRNGGTR